ncbi:helix-turn-helix domain-containing protein, partial [Streptococcus gallolyticus]|uniref:helix-turn-helix domain-containing protein n=1 Tax=Streptococcus gallolyticus TaxID=315405 RepID=UPI001313E241
MKLNREYEKTLGKTFKVIRKSKGLSQKEVAEGVISVAQLSRFERGISDVTADVLYICLQNMNVTMDEFQSVYHNFVQPQNIFLQNDISE